MKIQMIVYVIMINAVITDPELQNNISHTSFICKLAQITYLCIPTLLNPAVHDDNGT